MIEKCLEVIDWQDPFGKRITLQVDNKKPLVNLNPLFQDFFGERNGFLGIPVISWKSKNDKTQYNFSLENFVGSFFGTFKPEYFIEWIDSHLIKNNFSEDFISSLIKIEKENPILFPIYQQPYRERGKFYFLPLNIELNELNAEIKNSCRNLPRSYRKSMWHVIMRRDDIELKENKLSIPIFADELKKDSILNLRDRFLELRPRGIIYLYNTGATNSLNYFDLIKTYNLDCSHLELVRKQ